jgi:hypothetical protein
MAARVNLVAKRDLAVTYLKGKLRLGSSRWRGVDWHESAYAGHGDIFFVVRRSLGLIVQCFLAAPLACANEVI